MLNGIFNRIAAGIQSVTVPAYERFNNSSLGYRFADAYFLGVRLYGAAGEGNESQVRSLLEGAGDRISIEAQEHALEYAVRGGHIAVVRTLLNLAGAKLSTECKKDAIRLAGWSEHEQRDAMISEIVSSLDAEAKSEFYYEKLSQIEITDKKYYPYFVEIYDKLRTPQKDELAIRAVIWEDTQVLTRLINDISVEARKKALHMAIDMGHLEMARRLFDSYPEGAIPAKTFIAALKEGNFQIADDMLNQERNIEIESLKNFIKFIKECIRYGRQECVQRLLTLAKRINLSQEQFEQALGKERGQKLFAEFMDPKAATEDTTESAEEAAVPAVVVATESAEDAASDIADAAIEVNADQAGAFPALALARVAPKRKELSDLSDSSDHDPDADIDDKVVSHNDKKPKQ